ncbi:hypothetical protein D3C81_1908100 [compost metagenome]
MRACLKNGNRIVHIGDERFILLDHDIKAVRQILELTFIAAICGYRQISRSQSFEP